MDGWKTILFFWGPTYFRELCMLVFGSVPCIFFWTDWKKKQEEEGVDVGHMSVSSNPGWYSDFSIGMGMKQIIRSWYSK